MLRVTIIWLATLLLGGVRCGGGDLHVSRTPPRPGHAIAKRWEGNRHAKHDSSFLSVCAALSVPSSLALGLPDVDGADIETGTYC